MGDLLPCPFCGGTDFDPLANTVLCCDCGATGPLQDEIEILCDPDWAKLRWNTRALPAASSEDVRAGALDPATLEAVARMFDAIGNDAPMKGYECAKAVRRLIVEATANDLGWNELPENWEG